MCTMIVEKVEVSGSGKGHQGWFPLKQANVTYDHPYHAPLDHSLNISFVNEDRGLSARVAVELTPESAMGSRHRHRVRPGPPPRGGVASRSQASSHTGSHDRGRE